MAYVNVTIQAEKFILFLGIVEMGFLPLFGQGTGKEVFMAFHTRLLVGEMLRHLDRPPGLPVEISTVLEKEPIYIFGSQPDFFLKVSLSLWRKMALHTTHPHSAPGVVMG